MTKKIDIKMVHEHLKNHKRLYAYCCNRRIKFQDSKYSYYYFVSGY